MKRNAEGAKMPRRRRGDEVGLDTYPVGEVVYGDSDGFEGGHDKACDGEA